MAQLPHHITPDLLRSRYAYNPQTGAFTWLKSFDFLYGSRKRAGDSAGKWRGNDYVLSVNAHELPGRKLAWWFQTGEWPEFRIGVRDGNFHNLAWANLGPHGEILRARRSQPCPICETAFRPANKAQKTCSFTCASVRRAAEKVAQPKVCRDCGGTLGDLTRLRCTPCLKWVGRRRMLAKNYGLTPDAFQALIDRQNGVCAICGEAPDAGPVVDHDHQTGAIRGILCGSCNKGLGMFGDSTQRLRAAITYLAETQ